MLYKTRTAFCFAAISGLVACGQQEPPPPVGVQPGFTKYGEAICPEGLVLSGDLCVSPEAAAAGAA
uniref:hypothetical protein n=1 Tax=Roseovarius sp. TaxID=1486281 RepID=UPI003A976B08